MSGGINRGVGIEPFPSNDPPTGEGIFFDAYAILKGDGTGTLTDIVSGTVKALDPASISIAGNTITLRLAASLLPSEGFDFADHLYNLWPRYAPAGVEPGSNTQISDFAPDDKSFAATVPDPSSGVMLIGALTLTGAVMRRRACSEAAGAVERSRTCLPRAACRRSARRLAAGRDEVVARQSS
jgi:hypothetical protein